ncbi:MAG: glycosyltransferase [Marinilabilia sp.]
MKNHKTITALFCPLDWGLGHMARDMPLIRELHNAGHKVIVAASPGLISWLKAEMPEIQTTEFRGPTIRYSRDKHLFLKLLSNFHKFIFWPWKEKKRTAILVNKFHPDLIVSDNRYGARHPGVRSVIITHQLMIKMPRPVKWLEWPVHRLILLLTKKFDEIWVPDFPLPHSLAGDLVHKYPLPRHARLIGPLSRFDGEVRKSEDPNAQKERSILGIISGPEPQRTILEQKLRELSHHFTGRVTLITGTPSHQLKQEQNNRKTEVYSHLPTKQMEQTIKSHQTIIARAGYSTIMDMYFLGRSIWLVPTPGQTEQIYLATYHHKKNHLYAHQNHLFEVFKI